MIYWQTSLVMQYETMYEHALNVCLTRFQFVLCCLVRNVLAYKQHRLSYEKDVHMRKTCWHMSNSLQS